MSIIVEDGTIVDGANSYVSVQDAEDILLNLGYDTFPSETDLIQATLYIDTYLDPASFLLDQDQELLWPRQPFTDRQGREVQGIPKELKRATAIIAAEFEENDLFLPEAKIEEQQYGNSRERYFGPVSETKGKANTAILRLKSLGYGSGNTSTVHITRA